MAEETPGQQITHVRIRRRGTVGTSRGFLEELDAAADRPGNTRHAHGEATTASGEHVVNLRRRPGTGQET